MGEKGFNTSFEGPLFRELLSRPVRLDRPKGSRHPRFPSIVYPVDYGYVDLKSVDGEGLDVFVGTLPEHRVTGVILCLDLMKQELEPKVLISCTSEEIGIVRNFLEQELHMLVWSSSDAA